MPPPRGNQVPGEQLLILSPQAGGQRNLKASFGNGARGLPSQLVSANPIRIGVSACLLGESVRYDGDHKLDRLLTEALAPFVEWVPICPEFEIGMGIPREPIRLVERDGEVGLVGVRSNRDHTRAMGLWARRRVAGLGHLDLSGYVLKKDSPSCGLARVPVHRVGRTSRDGQGLFARALIERFPHLPVEEEGHLHDLALRENWIERVFAYRRLRDFFSARWTIGTLVEFHTAHKLTILAHAPAAYRELGRLVAKAKSRSRSAVRGEYEHLFMKALSRMATRGHQTNVLYHMAGYLREPLNAPSRRELEVLIEHYRVGLVPLVVPVTLLAHHARRLGIDFLLGQTYLQPHPKELALRNYL